MSSPLTPIVPYAVPVTDDKYRAEFLNGLHERIVLHPKQLEIAVAILSGKNVVVSCGRKFGKSVDIIYCAVRLAALFKFCYIYILAPLQKQVREIYWEPELYKRITPPGYIKRLSPPSSDEMRISFHTGSFVKFDGSDNPDMQRGPAVHKLFLDELKDCDPNAMTAMEPNLIATRGSFALFGTPPDEEESESAKMWFELMARPKTDPNTIGFVGSSEDNPYVDKELLKSTKARLTAEGRESEWLREYCGIYQRGGQDFIFPMWSDAAHVFDHEELLKEVEARGDKIEWWLIQDPATSSVFAQLYLAYDPENVMIYILDESYVTEAVNTTVIKMYHLEVAKQGEINPDIAVWKNLYDEQAATWANERQAAGIGDMLMATVKNKWKATDRYLKAGITTWRDILSYRRVKVSKRCKHFISEFRGYKKKYVEGRSGNRGGKKQKDHLIDTARYFVLASGFSIPEEIIRNNAMVPLVTKMRIEQRAENKPKISLEDLDIMIENDISEYFTAEAMKWID